MREINININTIIFSSCVLLVSCLLIAFHMLFELLCIRKACQSYLSASSPSELLDASFSPSSVCLIDRCDQAKFDGG